MLKKSIMSYHNSESPDSPLGVKYKYIKTLGEDIKNNDIIKSHTPKHNLLPMINYKKFATKDNDLRHEHFNSYSNENMDFFRLDYLKECDRNHYHNKYMNNIIPINRSENFEKLKKERKNIKFIDSLKKNFLLKKENNNKPLFNENLFTSENIISNNYYKKINNNNSNNLYNNDKHFDRYNYNKNIINHNGGDSIFTKITIDEPNYSGSYLSNINDYSIKENHNISQYNVKSTKNLSKMNDLRKQSHLFCKDVINNDLPALFYKLYDYHINKDGFKKQNNIFSDFANNSKKPGYITRKKYPMKINLTPIKKNKF